jgi:hypothetical protein
MSLQVTEDELCTVHYHTRTIDFGNAAPILLDRRYSHGGKEFLPDRAFAKWTHGGAIDQIKVSGYVLKKDRTTGQQRATLDYITPAHHAWGTRFATPAPDWLLELFADSPHTTPEGATA